MAKKGGKRREEEREVNRAICQSGSICLQQRRQSSWQRKVGREDKRREKSIGLSVRVAVSVPSNQASPVGWQEADTPPGKSRGEDRSKECNKNSRVRPQSNGGSLDSACMAEHMPVLGSQLAHTITREERERDFKTRDGRSRPAGMMLRVSLTCLVWCYVATSVITDVHGRLHRLTKCPEKCSVLNLGEIVLIPYN